MPETKQIQEIKEAFNNVNISMQNGSFDSVTKQINKLYLKSLKINYIDGINLYHEKTILILLFTEDYFKAISFIQYLLKEYKKSNELEKLTNIYGKFGAVLSRLNDFKSSNYYLNKALETTLALKPVPLLSIIAWHIELARNFNSQKNIKKALLYINKGLDFIGDNNQKEVISYKFYLLLDKLIYLIKLDNIKEAKILFNELSNKKLNDKFHKFSLNKAKIDLLMLEPIKNPTNFLELVNETLKTSIKLSNKGFTNDLLETLKIFHFNNNENELAYKYANKIIDNANKEKEKEISILKWQNTTPIESEVDDSEFEVYYKSELDIAAKYQQNFYSKIHLSKKLNIQTLYNPSKTLSGDYIGTFKLDENRTLLVLADVVGKGITASYISFMLDGVIKALIKSSETFNLKKSVEDINDIISDTLNNQGFLTLWAGVINTNEETLQSVNAGHLPAYVIKKNGKIILLKEGCTILGMFKKLPILDCEIVNFKKGDIVVAISDGVAETINNDGILFEKKFESLIYNLAKEQPFNFTNKLEEELNNFKDKTQIQDDVSCLFVEFLNEL